MLKQLWRTHIMYIWISEDWTLFCNKKTKALFVECAWMGICPVFLWGWSRPATAWITRRSHLNNEGFQIHYAARGKDFPICILSVLPVHLKPFCFLTLIKVSIQMRSLQIADSLQRGETKQVSTLFTLFIRITYIVSLFNIILVSHMPG